MLWERIQQQQRVTLLEQQVSAMPEYPIYREANGFYVIYIDGFPHRFAHVAEAEAAQLAARADWLRQHAGAA